MEKNLTEEDIRLLQEMSEMTTNALEKSLRETFNLDDSWSYRDINWIREDYMQHLLNVMGEENYRMVAGSRRKFDDDDFIYVRGQFMISSQAIENIRNRNPENDPQS